MMITYSEEFKHRVDLLRFCLLDINDITILDTLHVLEILKNEPKLLWQIHPTLIHRIKLSSTIDAIEKDVIVNYKANKLRHIYVKNMLNGILKTIGNNKSILFKNISYKSEHRFSCDIDILVSKANYNTIISRFLEQGYVVVKKKFNFTNLNQCELMSPCNNLIIDLHMGLGASRISQKNFLNLWNRSSSTNHPYVKTISSDDACILLDREIIRNGAFFTHAIFDYHLLHESITFKPPLLDYIYKNLVSPNFNIDNFYGINLLQDTYLSRKIMLSNSFLYKKIFTHYSRV